MDIVTLGAALNGSAEYVNSHFVGGSNIQIVDNPDGTQTINASGEVSSEDTVARADIAAIKDGETLDSFGDVETALADKVDKETGKGLSTNDYTTAEKTKLAGIAEGAEVNEIEGIKVNNTSVNPDANKVVNITVPTTAADVSALPGTTKYAAALSLTINSSTFVMTVQLKDQNGDNLGTAQTIDLPLESVVVGGSYNSQTQKVVLALQNGNTVEFSVADLVSGLQTELSTSNKLNPAFIEYDSTHRAVSDTEKSMWNSKQNALSSTQLDAVNSGIDSEKVEQIETNKNNISSLETANGAKNELDCNVSTLTPLNMGGVWSGNTYSINSGTTKFVINSDLTLTVSKSDTGTIRALILNNYIDGSILNGKVISGGSSNVPIVVQKNGGNYQTYAETTGNGVLIKGIPSGQATRMVISLDSDITCSNIVVKPMLCEKSLYDISSSYQPYALSNVELTAAIQALQAQLSNQ